jgi:hypothetical protein
MLRRGCLAAFAAALLGIAASASAAPVLYQYTSGQATITVTAGISTLAVRTLNLNGIFAEFDESTLSLTGFNFQTAPDQWLVLNTVYGGFDQVWINSANVVPGPGYATLSSAVLPGVGHYQVSVMPVVVNGVYTARNSITNATLGPAPISYTNATPLNANIDITAGTFTLQGVTLGIVPVPGETLPVIVTANLTFQGAQQVPVPEAQSLALAALALGMLALARRASRSLENS